MSLFTKCDDSRIRGNLSFRNRRKRFRVFQDMLNARFPRGLNIIDLGGSVDYWNQMNSDGKIHASVILVNIDKVFLNAMDFPSIIGDASNLDFLMDACADVVFSNSLIEHLPDFKKQERFAKDVRRIGKYYFIQTPAYSFLFEQHFLTPFFHFLPVKLRAFLLFYFNLGWFKKTKNMELALQTVKSIRLLKLSELRSLFPDAVVLRERFFGLTKSYTLTNLIGCK